MLHINHASEAAFTLQKRDIKRVAASGWT
jgi:hypothetical protein